ncbi:hypothetical protein EPO14_03895 [Patescibacteria group bacterium]|nr:MAG: hypothetical protein EPO14_03895 [Patescibacteria group bacterium]
MNKRWTVEKIKEGFGRFVTEYGRLPMAPEIDKLDYLPSARLIQSKFGGLEKLRAVLGYKDTHFGKGKFRSKIATRVNARGRDAELALEKVLREKFGEVFVHTERFFDDSKNRVDFYVYSPDGNFGIDIFYTDTMRDLQKNINIKIDKYSKFPHQLFLVVGNKDFLQTDLNEYVTLKTKTLPENTTITNLETLFEKLENRKSYSDPLKK